MRQTKSGTAAIDGEVMLDPKLKEWATPRQCEYIDAVNKHGSQAKAAKALGIYRRSIDQAIDRAKRNAALHGYAPEYDMSRPVPDTHIAKGVSTYYGKDGKVRGQWVKSLLDNEKWEQAKRAALDALAEDLPRVTPIAPPGSGEDDLCNVYTLTDCHVGMLAWHKEGGEDWDMKIAERVLGGCFEHMVQNSPPASHCLINQLGDFLHWDGIAPVTPTSGHIVDADGRFSKMVAVAIRILRRVIDYSLAKHQRVIVLLAEGNHDMASSVWLRHMFRALYENEPRVTVIDSELPYYTYQHGRTMLSFHHGHLRKNDQLPLLFAAQFPEVWGSTKKRYAHTGHRHHVEEIEHSGMVVHQHATLAARDAYASRGGWISERQVRAMTYHAEHGLVAVNVVTPEMLSD